MQAIKEKDYEVIARQRARLADGRMGWTGVMRAAHSTDCTVVGFRRNFVVVRFPHTNGQPGSRGERAYAKQVTSDQIGRG